MSKYQFKVYIFNHVYFSQKKLNSRIYILYSVIIIEFKRLIIINIEETDEFTENQLKMCSIWPKSETR